mgnify:CR=1 FL=1
MNYEEQIHWLEKNIKEGLIIEVSDDGKEIISDSVWNNLLKTVA